MGGEKLQAGDGGCHGYCNRDREGWTEGGAAERQFSAAVDGLPLGRKHILEQELLKSTTTF